MGRNAIIAITVLLIILSCSSEKVQTTDRSFSVELLTEFNVANGKIYPMTGTMESCEIENIFVLDALRSKGIDEPPKSYRVVSHEVKNSIITKAGSKGLMAFLYCIASQDTNQAAGIHELKRNIAANTYVTGLISGSKMPVTFHYFTCDSVLALLSYYGLPMYYADFEPESFIEKIKAECPCQHD